MTLLSALIRKRENRTFATAIHAIPATQTEEKAATVATIATVAVANSNNAERFQGIPLAEIQAEAGSDWTEIKADEVLLDTFARAVQARRMRERGEVPKHYTSKTICTHCGPVPIFEGAPERVLGCPWCFTTNRRIER